MIKTVSPMKSALIVGEGGRDELHNDNFLQEDPTADHYNRSLCRAVVFQISQEVSAMLVNGRMYYSTADILCLFATPIAPVRHSHCNGDIILVQYPARHTLQRSSAPSNHHSFSASNFNYQPPLCISTSPTSYAPLPLPLLRFGLYPS